MNQESFQLQQLLSADQRYPLEAYRFVRESLVFAQEVLKLGEVTRSEPQLDLKSKKNQVERHLTGQQLCEAAKLYALDQYGYMAKTVLASWGLTSTSSIGDIVYNLINIGLMKKSPADRREHFNNVFEFDEAFQQAFDFRADYRQPTLAKKREA